MKWQKEFADGKERYRERKYREALLLFSSIDVKDLDNFDESIVHHFAALCCSRLGRLDESIRQFRLAAHFRPHYAKIYFDMGMTYYFHSDAGVLAFLYRKKRLQKALRSFEEGILKDAQNAEYWYYHGLMHELLGNNIKAKNSFERCVKCRKSFDNIEHSTLFPKK